MKRLFEIQLTEGDLLTSNGQQAFITVGAFQRYKSGRFIPSKISIATKIEVPMTDYELVDYYMKYYGPPRFNIYTVPPKTPSPMPTYIGYRFSEGTVMTDDVFMMEAYHQLLHGAKSVFVPTPKGKTKVDSVPNLGWNNWAFINPLDDFMEYHRYVWLGYPHENSQLD